MRPLRCLLLALLLSTTATAAPLPKLAVLDFNMSGDVLPDDQWEMLNSAFRGLVVDIVGRGYDVMSKQTMMDMLPPGEVERCALLNECSVTIAKQVQAEYVVSGRIARIDGSLFLSVESHETNRGRQLGSEQFTAQKFLELLASLKRDGPALVRKWLPVAEKPPPVVVAPPQESSFTGTAREVQLDGAIVLVAFESTPPGAMVTVDGKGVCRTTPCRKSLAAGSHTVSMALDQYEETTQEVTVSASNKTVAVTLVSSFAMLRIETSVPGLPVLLDGREAGRTPLAELRVSAGSHEVAVRDSCWVEAGERIVVKKGESRTVRIEARERQAGLKLLALDAKGDELEAAVEVDGRRVGSTPLSAKVSACAREVVVKDDGGRTWKQALSLREGEVTRLTAELKAPVAACPADMVAIPAGTFDMGSTSSEAYSDEIPVHRATLSAFCMARTETTQAEWRRVMGSDPSRFNGDKRPVEQVSWNDAVAYCNKRSAMEGLRPAYDGSGNRIAGANGYRLPTEAEWEYAARAGTTVDRYGEVNDIAWYDGNSGSQTHDVGGKRPNAWGLYDMLGNVWEWTGDWKAEYGSGAVRDPTGPSGGSLRVNRGGCWLDGARGARASRRDRDDPGYRYSSLGFRPARSLP